MEKEQKQVNSIVLPKKIFAGEIHYSRIPVEYWQHRLKMVKSLGLNAVSIYIMWNYHEIDKGVYDFKTGNKNLSGFLELCQKYGFLVLIRPGPYVCAQWDFGGLPVRFLDIKDLHIRANNTLFMQQVKIYFENLVPIFQKHIKTQTGGSIILLQIENEYGFYGTDKSYMEGLKTIWRNLNIQIPLYYCDWIQNITKCHWVGSNIGLNNGLIETQYEFVRQFEPKGYIFGGQIYSGWFTHWSQKWGGKDIKIVLKEYEFLLENSHSFAMYMVHGGTNFGLTAGANGIKNQVYDYRSHITSYDYDAPINQLGQPTAKFYELKKLIQKYTEWIVPQIPDPIPTITFPSIKLQPYAHLLSNLPDSTVKLSEQLYPFQSPQLKMYNQGIVIYQTHAVKGIYTIDLVIHDCAYIYINGKFQSFLDRSKNTSHQLILQCGKLENNQIIIVVQAMGHINFDHQMETDKKGLISLKETKGHKFLWNIYKIPLEYQVLSKYTKMSGNFQPELSRVKFTLEKVGDCYINLENYRKGYLWVNGHNLGRYWSQVGPQTRLYCPGVWLKVGQNQIVVLQMLGNKSQEITGLDTLI